MKARLPAFSERPSRRAGTPSGVPFGVRKKDGSYPRNTINYRVDARLKNMAERLKGFYADEKKD